MLPKVAIAEGAPYENNSRVLMCGACAFFLRRNRRGMRLNTRVIKPEAKTAAIAPRTPSPIKTRNAPNKNLNIAATMFIREINRKASLA